MKAYKIKISTVLAIVFVGGTSIANATSVNGVAIPAPAKELLMDVLSASNVPSARVSNYERTAQKQATLILGVIKREGVAAAYVRYGAAGDAVIAVYEANKDVLDEPSLIGVMTAEVNKQVSALGANRTQLMHIPPTQHYTFDVAPSSISNRSRFEQELSGHPQIARLFKPGVGENAYHIEIPKTVKALSGSWPGTCSGDGDTEAFTLKLRRMDGGYVGGLEGDGQSFPLQGVVINRKSGHVQFVLNDDGDMYSMTGQINLNNSVIEARTSDNTICRWSK